MMPLRRRSFVDHDEVAVAKLLNVETRFISRGITFRKRRNHAVLQKQIVSDSRARSSLAAQNDIELAALEAGPKVRSIIFDELDGELRVFVSNRLQEMRQVSQHRYWRIAETNGDTAARGDISSSGETVAKIA